MDHADDLRDGQDQRPAGGPAMSPRLTRLHELAATGDAPARAALVEEYALLARSVARRYHRGHEPFEDLVQVAMEALIIAIDRFDPQRGLPFVAFAIPTMTGTIKRYYRDFGWSIRVPRAVHDLTGSIRHAVDLLEQDLGREPSAAEVADLLSLRTDEVEGVLAAAASRTARSLDEPEVESSVARPCRELARVEEQAALSRALGSLGDEERRAILRYYEDGWTQARIAEELGRSQIHVSRVLARALDRLRANL
jgi:RNA polymerase sigma-B factor